MALWLGVGVLQVWAAAVREGTHGLRGAWHMPGGQPPCGRGSLAPRLISTRLLPHSPRQVAQEGAAGLVGTWEADTPSRGPFVCFVQ